MGHGDKLPIEPPVLRELVDPRGGGNRIRSRRPGFLVVDLDAAGVVVDRDQIDQTIAVEVPADDGARIPADFDHFKPLEAEIPRKVGILGKTDPADHADKK